MCKDISRAQAHKSSDPNVPTTACADTPPIPETASTFQSFPVDAVRDAPTFAFIACKETARFVADAAVMALMRRRGRSPASTPTRATGDNFLEAMIASLPDVNLAWPAKDLAARGTQVRDCKYRSAHSVRLAVEVDALLFGKCGPAICKHNWR